MGDVKRSYQSPSSLCPGPLAVPGETGEPLIALTAAEKGPALRLTSFLSSLCLSCCSPVPPLTQTSLPLPLSPSGLLHVFLFRTPRCSDHHPCPLAGRWHIWGRYQRLESRDSWGDIQRAPHENQAWKLSSLSLFCHL